MDWSRDAAQAFLTLLARAVGPQQWTCSVAGSLGFAAATAAAWATSHWTSGRPTLGLHAASDTWLVRYGLG